jgi:ligand-binding sensor domain-containing protein
MKRIMKLVWILVCILLYHTNSNASIISIYTSNIVTSEPKEKLTIPIHGNIRTIFEDAAGNTWYGSDGDGLIKFDGKKFKAYTIKEGLSGNFVRGIVQDKKGNLWIATNAGIDIFNGLFFKNILSNEGNESKSSTCAFIDNNDVLWFGTKNGVYKVQNFKSTYIPIPKSPEDAKSTNHAYSVYSIAQDKQGNYWFGTEFKGLYKYNGKTFEQIYSNDKLKGAIRGVYADSKGKVWFGDCAGDLYTFDGAKVENITDKYNQKDIKKINSVWSIRESKDGTIWISSIEGGVWKIENQKLKHFPLIDNKASVGILFIHINKNNKIQLGGKAGIVMEWLNGGFEEVYLRDAC